MLSPCWQKVQFNQRFHQKFDLFVVLQPYIFNSCFDILYDCLDAFPTHQAKALPCSASNGRKRQFI